LAGLRIFLSFHSKDQALAEALRTGLKRLEPTAGIFLSSISLGAGFWVPKLAEEIAAADAFILLIGPAGVGAWQQLEYDEALDRHTREKERFPLVPVIAAGVTVPGLPFLRRLNWVEAPVVTEDRVLHRLVAALKGETVITATPLWKLVNPYRGLEAMTEANADYFYGRAHETAAVLTALADRPNRCPMLIGASGVGKSSVARAGVLSALKSMQWPGAEYTLANAWPAGLKNSRSWLSLMMRPGETPLTALCTTLIQLWRVDGRDPDQAGLPRKWAERLFDNRNSLSDLINTTLDELRKRAGDAPERILIYIDQGEELYTRAPSREASRFSEVMAEGLNDPRFSAFASLRADYFDRFQADVALFKCREHVDVPPLDRTQLNEIVTSPPRALQVVFEDDKIASRITDAAAAEQLPLLSYLLHDMWSGMILRGDATLRLPPQVIDVGGVLASRADEFLAANRSDESALRRLLTLRLAHVPFAGDPVRRQAARDECDETEWALASRLADYPWRLVVVRERTTIGASASDDRIVAEVAHEALLRAWPTLEQWLREQREFLIFKGEAERSEQRWREMGESDNALLTGLDLARAEEWLASRPDDLSGRVFSYAQKSLTAERAKSERQLRIQRRATLGWATAAILMAINIGYVWMQWNEATRERDRAIKGEASAESELQLVLVTQSRFLADLSAQQREKGDAGTALLLALEALPDIAAGATRPYVSDAEFQFERAWASLRELVIYKGGRALGAVAISPDGRMAVTPEDNAAQLWDMRTGRPIGQPLVGHLGLVSSAAFRPDGRQLVTASGDKTARLWNVETGKPTGEVLTGHRQGLSRATFSPDGNRIVTSSGDGTARVWDTNTGKTLVIFSGHEGTVWSAAFSPDGKRIVTGSHDRTARVWEVDTGKQTHVLEGRGIGLVFDATFSPDGTRIVTASSTGVAQVWSASTGELLFEVKGHEGWVRTAVFSPDGTYVLTASDDHTARLWDGENGAPIGEPFRGHMAALSSAAFGPNGNLVTASADATARVWDVFARRYLDGSQTLLTQARLAIPRCLTVSQRSQFFLTAAPPAWCIELEKWPYHTDDWKQWLAQTRAGEKPSLPASR
jgi:WD40 repeat protein